LVFHFSRSVTGQRNWLLQSKYFLFVIWKVSVVKKLLIWLFVSAGLLVIACGCNGIAKKMNKDAALYSSKCSSCHNLIEPSRFGKEQWRLCIDKYGRRMAIEEKQLLLAYLTDPAQD
jgi:hypothetical protein